MASRVRQYPHGQQEQLRYGLYQHGDRAMSLTADQKKGLPADIIAEIEEDEKAIARLNSENADRRAKYNQAEKEKKAVETMLTSLRESMEKVGLRTDSDIEEQFPVLIEKITKDKGYKPSSEVDALTKQVAALTKKYEAAEAAAVAEKREAMLERVGGTFDPLLQENFGVAAPLVKDLLRTKGRFAMKDGVAGIQNGDEFLPLNAEKGSVSAIDQLKKEYGNLVVTKQRPGTGGGGANNTSGKNDKLMSRADFDALAPLARMDFMKNGGQLSENVE
jgi:hypothetical protein